MATEHLSPLYPTAGDSQRRLVEKILLTLILTAQGGGGGGLGGVAGQIKYYTNDPNVEGIVPDDQSKPAIAIPTSGAGPWFSWSIGSATWI